MNGNYFFTQYPDFDLYIWILTERKEEKTSSQPFICLQVDQLQQSMCDRVSYLCSRSRSIHFGRDACSHLMIIATDDQIQCWDLASGAISWYSEIENINFLVQDQFSENMALFTNDQEGIILVYWL